jgi:glycosyltransferase involved in cell wall biosynthesis
MRHLAGQGHDCRAVTPTPAGDEIERERVVDGIAIHSVPHLQRHPGVLAEEIRAFAPEWVLVSSEDVAHVLLRAAAQAAPGRMVYLAHTPQFLPFGPESWNPDETAAAAVRRAAGVVVIGHHMAAYVRTHLGVEAAVIHPPIYGRAPYRQFGRFGSGTVLMVNPCAVKGIGIFLALADRFPTIEFAALKGWGTTAQDREALTRRPNVRLLGTVPDIASALCEARFLLMPSLWYEGFGLIAMEAMLRGLPVIASDSGGLEEAKRGTGYVVPVRPIARYERAFDDTGMPRAVVPEQEIAPWAAAMQRLLSDEAEYWAEAGRSRAAALEFVSGLDAGDFEKYLQQLHRAAPDARALTARLGKLDPQQRARLLEQVRARKGLQ